MSQLKVNAIRATAASSDAITLATDGTATAKITNNLSNRNLMTWYIILYLCFCLRMRG